YNPTPGDGACDPDDAFLINIGSGNSIVLNEGSGGLIQIGAEYARIECNSGTLVLNGENITYSGWTGDLAEFWNRAQRPACKFDASRVEFLAYADRAATPGDATSSTTVSNPAAWWPWGDLEYCGNGNDCNAPGADLDRVTIHYSAASANYLEESFGAFGSVIPNEHQICHGSMDPDINPSSDHASCYPVETYDTVGPHYSISFKPGQSIRDQEHAGYPRSRKLLAQSTIEASCKVLGFYRANETVNQFRYKADCTDGALAAEAQAVCVEGDGSMPSWDQGVDQHGARQGQWIRFADPSGGPGPSAHQIVAVELDHPDCPSPDDDLIVFAPAVPDSHAKNTPIWADPGGWNPVVDEFYLMKSPPIIHALAPADDHAEKMRILSGEVDIQAIVMDGTKLTIRYEPVFTQGSLKHYVGYDIHGQRRDGKGEAIMFRGNLNALVQWVSIAGGSERDDCLTDKVGSGPPGSGSCAWISGIKYRQGNPVFKDISLRYLGGIGIGGFFSVSEITAPAHATIERLTVGPCQDESTSCGFVSEPRGVPDNPHPMTFAGTDGRCLGCTGPGEVRGGLLFHVSDQPTSWDGLLAVGGGGGMFEDNDRTLAENAGMSLTNFASLGASIRLPSKGKMFPPAEHFYVRWWHPCPMDDAIEGRCPTADANVNTLLNGDVGPYRDGVIRDSLLYSRTSSSLIEAPCKSSSGPSPTCIPGSLDKIALVDAVPDCESCAETLGLIGLDMKSHAGWGTTIHQVFAHWRVGLIQGGVPMAFVSKDVDATDYTGRVTLGDLMIAGFFGNEAVSPQAYHWVAAANEAEVAHTGTRCFFDNVDHSNLTSYSGPTVIDQPPSPSSSAPDQLSLGGCGFDVNESFGVKRDGWFNRASRIPIDDLRLWVGDNPGNPGGSGGTGGSGG
ncbi:MAG: hypothetical protein AAEJ52_10145, partial [Myxococcota bacterium]